MEQLMDSWQLKAACRGPQAEIFFPPAHAERKEEKLQREERAKSICATCSVPVSYTHLDVYKRQLLSWSVAKSMLHAVVGMLVGDGLLDPASPADVPLWSTPDDPRGAITLGDLLAMRDGLAFFEEYEDPETSDVIQMLFGRGQADMAAFAADRPLASAPGLSLIHI